MVGLILAEGHLRLLSGIGWLNDTIRVFDSIGLGSHLAAYSAVLFLVLIMFIVWRMTRAPLPR
jgi:hypothetical protein